MKRLLRGIVDRLGRLARRRAPTAVPTKSPKPAPPPARKAAPPGRPGAKAAPSSGRRLVYAPQVDGRPDPGEIVWTWVPYEEDPKRGKDRPVLVVARDGSTLEGLMLSSNSDRDGQRNWFALGPGAWDKDHRPSWVRLDRVLPLSEDGIRREGSVLDRRRFEAVAAELRRTYGWA